MQQLPFDKPGRFWRGNLHTHSTGSDGMLSPQQTCERYRRNGYDFIAITDHYLPRFNLPVTDTTAFRQQGFTTLLGAELHIDQTECGEWFHVPAVGLPLDFAPANGSASDPALVQQALDAGAFVTSAHPARCGLSMADVLSLGAIHGIEGYNGGAENHNDMGHSWALVDALLSRGHRYVTTAVDDAHMRDDRQPDFMMGWVYVKAESLTPEALLTALKNGHFYASTGPQIHDVQVIPGESVTVRCSPVDSIFVSGRVWQSRFEHHPGLTEATFDISRLESPFCRVIVRDRHHHYAWSNPIWFD